MGCEDGKPEPETYTPSSFAWPKKAVVEVDPEALVISECFEALMRLYNPDDRKRVVRYLFERFDAAS